MKLYHGSPRNLESLKPMHDKRTDHDGIWLTDIKEHALIFAFLPESKDADVEWHSKSGTFTKALVKTNDMTAEGFLYVVEVPEELLEKIDDHSWLCKKEVLQVAKEPVHKEVLSELSIAFQPKD